MPLPMSALRESLRLEAASNRCTITWSAPCDAIERNAPPINPAKSVYGLSKPK